MIRAFQWDLARQVERLDFLKQQLPLYAAWGYQELYIHLEDAVHYPSLPGIGRADAYSYKELGELVQAARHSGIGVVPIVNLLGHTQYLIKHADWRDLNELRDADDQPHLTGQISPSHPRTLEVAQKLLRDMAPFCTAGKVHVGLDESFHLGKAPNSRAEVERIGLAGHFAGYVNRLHGICEKLRLQMGLWADMLYFIPEAIPQLPRGIIAYDWYYYPFGKKPRVELFNFAERDLLPALTRQGITYYGCPMNGAFRYEPLPVFGDRLGNIRSWWERCQKLGAAGFLVTSWEAYRLALETTTVVDAAAASLWLKPGADDATSMLADGLERVFQIGKPRALARSLLAADEHAFSGYARWQINDRWDVFAGTESVKPYQAEERFFARLLTESRDWRGAFTASLAFRHYLAQRDVFVRQSARAVFKLRRLRKAAKSAEIKVQWAQLQSSAKAFLSALGAGRKAARAMWTRTRNPEVQSHNELILERDAQRLRTWRAWLQRAARTTAILFEATPLTGAWQLQFMVHNFAPAVQKVIVEQQLANGNWHELGSRFTIEFRAAAARPRSRLKREFTVPVNDHAGALRIAVRGVGRVAISHVQLTDGVATRRWRGHAASQKLVLGSTAPDAGLPLLDWVKNSEAVLLDFK